MVFHYEGDRQWVRCLKLFLLQLNSMQSYPLRRQGLWLLLFMASGLSTLGPKAANAYQVTLNPAQPQLGDTITVLVTPESPTPDPTPPTVTLKGKQYPAFAIGNNRYRALVPTSPLDTPGQMTLQVSGAEPTRNVAFQLRGRSFRTQWIDLPPGKTDLGTDYEFDKVDAFKTIVSPKKFWNGAFARPSTGYVSTEYGVRRYYNGVFANDYYHRGVDYADYTGSPVKAPAGGQVRLVGYERDGFEIHGNIVGVDHGQGVLSLFIHLNSISVKEGDYVQPGQVIGTVGTTGASTGPHLHWGLYVHGVGVDPVPWRDQGFL